MGKPIVVKGCTILINGGVIQTPTPLTIDTDPDPDVTINNIDTYFGDVDVTVPQGASGSAGTLSKPVKIKITATGEGVETSLGKALVLNDQSSGEDTGTFVQGQTSTDVPLTLVITDAGQTDVTTG